jgi:chromosome segregation ATPase
MKEVTKYLEKEKNDIYLEEKEVEIKMHKLRKELAQIERGRTELIKAVKSGNMTNEELTPQIKDLNAEQLTFQTAIAKLELKISTKKERHEKYLWTYTIDHLAEFSSASIEKQRKYYQEAIESFIVTNGEIQITFITGAHFEFKVVNMEEYRNRLQVGVILSTEGLAGVRRFLGRLLPNKRD